MPRVEVVFFMDDDGSIPVLDWFDGLSSKTQAKCLVKIERLREMGHELRRPEADYLRDGIYELRVGLRGQNYRILYAFHNRTVAVLAVGLMKEQRVPKKAIETAIRRMSQFAREPAKHTYKEGR